jgi:hypothetical protein
MLTIVFWHPLSKYQQALQLMWLIQPQLLQVRSQRLNSLCNSEYKPFWHCHHERKSESNSIRKDDEKENE